MTTQYTIAITKTNTYFKVTYRDAKFRRLEHLRGKFDQEMMNALGKVIPQQEKDLPNFLKNFYNRVSYTALPTNKAVSIYSEFNSAWFKFFRKQNNGIDPKFTGADGMAMKQIINYLKDINGGDEAAALSNWFLILDNWKLLIRFSSSTDRFKIYK